MADWIGSPSQILATPATGVPPRNFASYAGSLAVPMETTSGAVQRELEQCFKALEGLKHTQTALYSRIAPIVKTSPIDLAASIPSSTGVPLLDDLQKLHLGIDQLMAELSAVIDQVAL